jgi:hypothetical protein
MALCLRRELRDYNGAKGYLQHLQHSVRLLLPALVVLLPVIVGRLLLGRLCGTEIFENAK